jgi:hypothetical protein
MISKSSYQGWDIFGILTVIEVKLLPVPETAITDVVPVVFPSGGHTFAVLENV